MALTHSTERLPTEAHAAFGARCRRRMHGGKRVSGVEFSVWAPHARAVAVAGSFNHWRYDEHTLQRRNDGVWHGFVTGVAAGDYYKFRVTDCHGHVREKTDPLARAMELAPGNASIVVSDRAYGWHDADWLSKQQQTPAWQQPMSVYELHAGSWRRHPDGCCYTYAELADALIPYLQELGYSHVELLPVTEHPFAGSWGYQPVGLFAPTARFGTPNDLRRFVDRLHQAGIGVILDWVPAHFPRDEHGLFRFDGTALYEHADPHRGEHPDWQTLIYDYGKPEVRTFLIRNALYWLQEFHFDGLRIDAVASMLYLDYSRKPGEWLPNSRGGNEHDEAIQFLRELNDAVHQHCPGAFTIAEESTAWPGVTTPTAYGGLGFDFKWNMGWMHDSLRYLSKDPVYRKHHHGDITFGLSYAFSERFVLALSHDEVVHGKGSLYNKSPGDHWQKFANLRAYHALQYGHPGKKLLFMGMEFGQVREWNHDRELDWGLLAETPHRQLQQFHAAMNQQYRKQPALWQQDHDPAGFEWIEASAGDISVYAFVRWDVERKQPMLVVSNFTPVVRHGFRVGVPGIAAWRECFNSDALVFGGSGISNSKRLQADTVAAQGRSQSIMIELPPLATLWLQPEPA